MTLDRWIAFFFLLVFLIYGYTAWFTMDASLPPIMKHNPIWPSSFPKIIAILGVVVSLVVIFNIEKTTLNPQKQDINYRRLGDYKIGQAVLLLSLMVAYAFLLRPMGFLLSTFLFLSLGSAILGERRYVLTAVVALITSLLIWYLVEQVLGIFLRPLPFFL